MKINIFITLVLLYSGAANSMGFEAGTSVATSDGFIPIETIKVGMKVYSCDEDLACTSSTVTHVKTLFQKSVEVVTPLGKIAGGSFKKIYVNHTWVMLKDIQVGDKLVHHSGLETEVQEVTRKGNVKLFAIEVDPFHNFYANGLLTHNSLLDPKVLKKYSKDCVTGMALGFPKAVGFGVGATAVTGGNVPSGLLIFGLSEAQSCAESVYGGYVTEKINEGFDNICTIM